MATTFTNVTRQYRDLDLNFNIHPVRKDINKTVGDMAVINSIKNLISTNNYERLFNPELGCNLKRYLFEPIDNITTNNIIEEITKTIVNYETRVQLLDVTANPDYDKNGYDVSIKFIIRNDPQPITITFFLERVR